MSGSEDISDEEQCAMVVDAALGVVTEECGSEKAVRRQLMDLLGFGSDESPPDCDELLRGGVTDDVVQTMQRERSYAMCRAWRLVEDEGMNFREAINKAWMEIREHEDSEA